MRPSFLSACVASVLALTVSVFAGQPAKDVVDPKKNPVEPCPPDTLTWVRLRSSYTGESDFKRGTNERGEHGDASGDALWNSFIFNQRIPLNLFGGWPGKECGQWYLRAGAEYERFSFDNEGTLPLPNTLQGFNGIFALEYVVRDDAVLSLEVRPGFFFEQDIDLDDFDLPVSAYGVVYDRREANWSFSLVLGASYRSFRSTPFIPAVGFVFRTGKLTIYAIPPEPRIIYAATDRLNLWASYEISGGSFRTDGHDFRKKSDLNEALVTYSEKRIAAGFSYKWSNWTLDLGAGYAYERKFDFHRAEHGYSTNEGAPFAKVELRAGF